MSEQTVPFASWAILEVMGHRRLGGFVRECEIAGAGLLRLDIPGEEDGKSVTQFYAPGSLYCLTPCSEAAARAVAKANQPEPVHAWELPAAARPVSARPQAEYDVEYDPEQNLDDDDEGPEL